MPLTRQERIALHQKQERSPIKVGSPKLNDLTEGVPEFWKAGEGVIEYTKINNVIYKRLLSETDETGITIEF